MLTIGLTACQTIAPLQVSLAAVEPDLNLGIIQIQAPDEVRSYDGTGNNIDNPDWGSANIQLLRYSPAEYGDGISTPAGSDRPSARIISNTFGQSPEDGILNDRDFTAFVYAWGQFIDHDIDLTVSADPRESFPIVVPTGDEWFDPNSTGEMTIPVSRSNYDPLTGTSTSNPRQQVNSITSYIDGSVIYGSDKARADALREFSGGRMKMGNDGLLAFNTEGFENANDTHIFDDTQLYLSGDVRANENPELLSLHILFTREHNRVTAETEQEHPDWSDEELYQYARQIVIAELQKITFEEFLPSILGRTAIPAYRGYRDDVNPSIANEFSTGAFRFGHSMLGDDIEFLDNDGEEVFDPVSLRDSFFNPSIVQETGIDSILKYLASDNAQEIDTVAVDDIRNFLFGSPGQGGFDLASLNIQRGRDHGLADYNAVRDTYDLDRVTSFEEISSDKAIQASLASTYGNVDNIDLWVGGLAEDHLPGSSLGETFTAIIVNQFTRLRDGDRFWYENSLSRDLIREVQNTTLADIIRRNTNLTKLQANVFFFNDSTVMIDSAQTQNQIVVPENQQLQTPTQDNETDPLPPQDGPRNRPPRRPGNGRPGGNRPPR